MSKKTPKMLDAKARSPRWAFMQTLYIPDASDPEQRTVYLKRLRIIGTPLFGIFLHHIYRPDSDRDPHDHPWKFGTLILRGGYNESVFPEPSRDPYYSVIKRWGRFSFHRMPLKSAHIITELKPKTVTLVFVGRRTSKGWGFYQDGKYIPWQDYNAQKFGPDPFNS